MLTLSQWVQADAKSEILYRQGVMSVVGGHMKSMATSLKGGIHMDEFAVHAHGMANISKIVPNVFPEGSGDGKTEALAEIWENKAEFKAAMDKFLEAADGMAVAADTGEMASIGPAIKALGGSCKGCHDDFKQE